MRSQHTQSAENQGDWDRSRNEQDPQRTTGSDYGRQYQQQRGSPEHYPESHYQYQAQREHPGIEYFSGGYGGRSEYGQSQQGMGGGYGSQREGYGSRPEAEQHGQGAYRQQEAFQSGGRQQGYSGGSEDFNRGGYGREERPGQFGQGSSYREGMGAESGHGGFGERPYESAGRQQGGWGESGRGNPGYGQGGFQSGTPQSPWYGQQQTPGSSRSAQGYGGYQTGQPQDYGNREGGVFRGQEGYPSGGQPSGGYGSYGSYQTGSQQAGMQSRPRRGPKDYVRSDERIRELICENLAHHPSIDASEVSVQVREGKVTLEGTVPERRMKHEIEDVADGCWGVADVENRIRVQRYEDFGKGAVQSASAANTANVSDMSATETGSQVSQSGGGGGFASSARKAGVAESKPKGKEQEGR